MAVDVGMPEIRATLDVAETQLALVDSDDHRQLSILNQVITLMKSVQR